TPTVNSGPDGITLAPGGTLWFAELRAGQIAGMTTAGAIAEFPIPTANGQPAGITMGPDGALWFTEFAANKIGRLPLPPPCSPRPSVSVSVVPSGAGRLQVTLAANLSLGMPTNALQSLVFGAATGALIDVPGGQSGASGNFTVSLPAGTQQTTFSVRQAAAGQPLTVPPTAVA